MKTTFSSRTKSAAFTMIEMIGVLAVIAILASVITPSVLRSIEAAAVSAERQTLSSFSDQIRRSVRDTAGTVPLTNTWTTAIQQYVNASTYSLAVNRRGQLRVYLTDTAVPSTGRAVIISVMTANTFLTPAVLPPYPTLPPPPPSVPTQAAITNAVFQEIWDTPDNSYPKAPLQWAGWAAWSAVTNSEQCLVIQRINIKSDIPQNFQFTLNNPIAPAGKYRITHLGIVGPTQNATIPTTPPLTQVAGDLIELLDAGGALKYSYVVSSSGKTFSFDGTTWTTP